LTLWGLGGISEKEKGKRQAKGKKAKGKKGLKAEGKWRREEVTNSEIHISV
jgi:hypothetical protein